MSKKAKSKKTERKLHSVSTHPVWTTLPATIKVLQNSRAAHIEKSHHHYMQAVEGINVSIILLSAICIEGFFVECLLAFTDEAIILPKDTLKNRLLHELRVRISGATFSDYPDLFALVLGNKLHELIKNEPLIEAIIALIGFRNGFAHGRSISFETYTNIETQMAETEIQKHYKRAYEYLIKYGLIAASESLTTVKVADHFAERVFPFMNLVRNVLPEPQKSTIRFYIEMAGRNYNKVALNPIPQIAIEKSSRATPGEV